MSVIDKIWGLAAWVEEAAVAMWGIIVAVYGIVSTLYIIVTDILGLFPPVFQGVIVVGFLISIAFYIYNNYISGITIAGFKLP